MNMEGGSYMDVAAKKNMEGGLSLQRKMSRYFLK
jgi:hypothetical protein